MVSIVSKHSECSCVFTGAAAHAINPEVRGRTRPFLLCKRVDYSSLSTHNWMQREDNCFLNTDRGGTYAIIQANVWSVIREE